jgi:hypothetical protein
MLTKIIDLLPSANQLKLKKKEKRKKKKEKRKRKNVFFIRKST